MTTERRKFTAEDRLSILKEVEREGRANTLRKYNIAPSLYDRWRKKYLNDGLKGLKDSHKHIENQIYLVKIANNTYKVALN